MTITSPVKLKKESGSFAANRIMKINSRMLSKIPRAVE
jgi:hypothetical protein